MDAKLSYVKGAETPPLREDTIGEALDEAARRWGGVEAVVSVLQGVRWTFGELKARADALAAGLLALGLGRGERVGIWSPNNAEWVLTQFATAKAGLILVTINPAYRVAELEYALNKVGVPRAGHGRASSRPATTSAWCASSRPELANARPAQLRRRALPHLRRLIQIGGEPQPGWFGFDEVAALGGERAARARWRRWHRRCRSTTRSTSSSPPAPPARPRARR